MLPVTMLFVIIDEATVIWVLMMQLSIFMGLMLDIEVWSIMEFSDYAAGIGLFIPAVAGSGECYSSAVEGYLV